MRFLVLIPLTLTSLIFSSILCAADFSLTASVLEPKKEQGLGDLYKDLSKLANTKGKSFIEEIVTDGKTSYRIWGTLIEHGFEADNITSSDLFFVIGEFSKPYWLSKNNAEKLFDAVIIERLKHSDSRDQIIKLLTTPDRKVGDSLISKSTRDERHSLLLDCIEYGYSAAFKAMLKAWPDDQNDFYLSTALTREEYKDASGYFGMREYNYEKKAYSLIGWMMRNDGSAHTYLVAGYSQNQKYVEAAKNIADFMREKKVQGEGSALAMVALLARQNLLPSGCYLNHYAATLKSLSGFNKSTVPFEQLLEIGDKMPSNLVEAWRALK